MALVKVSRRILFLLLPLFCFSCTSEKQPGSSGGETGLFKSQKKPVQVIPYTIVSREVPLVITASGKTLASDRFEAKAPTAVKIQKVFVEEGAKVEPGDPLIRFDDQEQRLRLNKARADIREAEAKVAYETYLRQNREELISEGKLSDVEAEGIDERTALAQATIERAHAEVELYEGISDLVQINSPIAGVVTKKSVSEGSTATEKEVLITVVRLDPIFFVFSVPSDYLGGLGGVEKGAEIQVHFPSLPGQEFAGQLVSVGSEASSGESASGGVGIEAKLSIPNQNLVLKGDMNGEVVVRSAAKKKIFPVVENALLRSDKSVYVFKIDGNHLKKIPVILGDPSNGQPTIEKGVADGDQIVAADVQDLKDGMTVEALGAGR
jgi:RND family efflux transporter MFP subunit